MTLGLTGHIVLAGLGTMACGLMSHYAKDSAESIGKTMVVATSALGGTSSKSASVPSSGGFTSASSDTESGFTARAVSPSRRAR